MDLKGFLEKNNYQLYDNIPSNWDRYGTGIPSVTGILSLIKDKGFEYIKKKYPKQLQDAANRGTLVHETADLFFNGESNGEILHPQIVKFHTLHRVNIDSLEQQIVKDISGTIDLVGDVYIAGVMLKLNIDYKSSIKQSAKYLLQLGGYKYLNNNSGAILYLGDKKYNLVLVDDFYEDIFIELKDLFFHKLNSGQVSKPLKS